MLMGRHLKKHNAVIHVHHLHQHFLQVHTSFAAPRILTAWSCPITIATHTKSPTSAAWSCPVAPEVTCHPIDHNAVVQSSDTMKCLLGTMLVLTKQDRLC